MLCAVVGVVDCTRFPVYAELALADSVSDPVEAHVHCLGALDLDRVVGDAFRGGVICLDGSGALLLPAHFLQSVANDACFLSVAEQASYFGLGS